MIANLNKHFSIKFLSLFFFLFFFAIPNSFSATFKPRDHVAEYTMTWKFGITLTAKVTERFFKKNNEYTMEITAKGTIGNLAENARMDLSQSGWNPISYRKIETILGKKKSTEYLFDWENKKVNIINQDLVSSIPLPEDTFDPLTLRAELAYQFITKKPVEDSVRISTIEGGSIRSRKFLVAGSEIISVPFGNIEAIKLELFDHQLKNEKYFVLWLAPSLDYQMVKLEQKKKNQTLLFELYHYEKGSSGVGDSP